MFKTLLISAILLFAMPIYADCGQPHGSPPGPSGPPAPSTAPSGPVGGDQHGAGTVGDQLGRSLDPKGGGGMGSSLFDTGSGGGDKNLLKKFPKDSPEWKELKKSEHQVKVAKENAVHAKDQAADALKDLSKARRETERAELRLKDSQKLKGEEGDRILKDLKYAIDYEIESEKISEVKLQKFDESLTRSAKAEARQALENLSESRRLVESAGVKAADHGGNAGEGRRNVEALRESMHNEAKAEAQLDKRMREFDDGVDKVVESKNHYESLKAELGSR